MLELKNINDFVLSKFLLDDIPLMKMACTDEAIINLEAGLGITLSGFEIYGVYKNTELICCIAARLFTNATCEGHIFLSSKHQSTGIFSEIQQLFCKYMKEYTHCRNILAYSPKSCVQVHKTLLRNGWSLIGTVPNGIKWRGVVEDYTFYSKEI